VEKAIEVKGLRKSFKDTEVLKGVDFEVEKGSIFALFGSNGAYKTTIVNILTTLLKQDGDSATVNDFDVASKPESMRQSKSNPHWRRYSAQSSAKRRKSKWKRLERAW